MTAIQDVTRYLRGLDKVIAALESAEVSAVETHLANPATHNLPSLEDLYGQIQALRIGVERAVIVAETKLKRLDKTEGSE